MKRFTLSILFILCILVVTGCKEKEIFITADEIYENTMLVKRNGELQVAVVEKFDKTYYKLSELSEFVTREVSAFNKNAGGEKVKIDDLKIKEGLAVMLLSYSGMDQYSAFNEVMAAYFNAGIANIPIDMPKNLISAKDGSLAVTGEVLQNSKYKVLVIYEPFEVVVDGRIAYYSEEAQLTANNKLQSAKEGMTVVVYRP